ncbi:hypothetical protein AK812_SmicGene18132 [Symbiodinium microadriaticum]|uniref:Uncharacterized protein n=1 Tax=Symbiodinium microadriaticum TaxID=2951 RepID=A0A1Q9DVX8_SYMMI|nr:hypothetical protein AK812_SmicGene18132 [Symbiodinium microadriaticum]
MLTDSRLPGSRLQNGSRAALKSSGKAIDSASEKLPDMVVEVVATPRDVSKTKQLRKHFVKKASPQQKQMVLVLGPSQISKDGLSPEDSDAEALQPTARLDDWESYKPGCHWKMSEGSKETACTFSGPAELSTWLWRMSKEEQGSAPLKRPSMKHPAAALPAAAAADASAVRDQLKKQEALRTGCSSRRCIRSERPAQEAGGPPNRLQQPPMPSLPSL